MPTRANMGMITATMENTAGIRSVRLVLMVR